MAYPQIPLAQHEYQRWTVAVSLCLCERLNPCPFLYEFHWNLRRSHNLHPSSRLLFLQESPFVDEDWYFSAVNPLFALHAAGINHVLVLNDADEIDSWLPSHSSQARTYRLQGLQSLMQELPRA